MASEEIITTRKWKIPQPLWRCGTSTWFSFYGNHGEANCWWCTRVTSPTGSKQTTTTWITLYKNHSNYHQPEPWSLQPGNEVWGRLQRFRKPAKQWWDPQPDGPPGHQQGDPDLPVSLHGTLVHNHLKHSPLLWEGNEDVNRQAEVEGATSSDLSKKWEKWVLTKTLEKDFFVSALSSSNEDELGRPRAHSKLTSWLVLVPAGETTPSWSLPDLDLSNG